MRRGRRWQAAVLIAALLVPATVVAESTKAPKVLFIGVDGASWKVIDPLIKAGELPTLANFVREGAYTPAFESMGGGASPLIWTTIATGRSPEDHGITSFVTEMPNGSRVPVTSSSRKVRAIWEIASEHDVSVGVIGYWASWPAEQVNGYVITDHANSAYSEFLFTDGRMWNGAPPERLSMLRQDFLPLEIGPILAEEWITRENFPYKDMQRRGGFNKTQMELFRSAPWNIYSDYYSLLKTMYRVDYPLARIAGRLMVERPTDLVIVYLRGPDPVQHLAWDLYETEAYEVPNPNLERDRGLVEGVYRAIDTMLADLLRHAGPQTWVIVASDHGVEPSPAATGNPRTGRPGEHPETAKGVLFLRGPHVKRGYLIREATPYDLMPTFAWLLGLPLAEDLEGKVLKEAFEDSFAAGRAVSRIASYGVRETANPQASPADQLMLDLLKALGYISD